MHAIHFLRVSIVCALVSTLAACNSNPPKASEGDYQYKRRPVTLKKLSGVPRTVAPKYTGQESAAAKSPPQEKVTVAQTSVVSDKQDSELGAPAMVDENNARVKQAAALDKPTAAQRSSVNINANPDPAKIVHAAKRSVEPRDIEERGLATKKSAAAKPSAEPKPVAAPPARENKEPLAVAAVAGSHGGKDKNVPAARTEAVNKYNSFTLDDLPLTLAGAWQLDLVDGQCLLKSRGLRMPDGQGGTPLTLVVSDSAITLLTRSNIDLSYSGTGVKIDNTKPLPLEAVEGATNLVFSAQRNELLKRMVAGSHLELTVGFWPTWPQTKPHRVAVSLAQFSAAMAAWQQCNNLLHNDNI